MGTFESVAMATETRSYFFQSDSFQVKDYIQTSERFFIVEVVMGLHVRHADVNIV